MGNRLKKLCGVSNNEVTAHHITELLEIVNRLELNLKAKYLDLESKQFELEGRQSSLEKKHVKHAAKIKSLKSETEMLSKKSLL